MNIKDDTYKFSYLMPFERLQFPLKINIHMPIRGDLYFECLRINRMIREITKSEVSFDASSFQIPHLTFYMGFVESFSNLQYLLKETEKFSEGQKGFEVTPSKPYIKKPQNNWIFIDINPTEKIIEIKRSMEIALSKYIVPLSWDVVAEIPHITIGYVKQNQYEIEKMLENLEINLTSRFEAFEVSFSGARGACLGSIRTYELPTNSK